MTNKEMWHQVRELRRKPAPGTNARIAGLRDGFERSIVDYSVANPAVRLQDIGKIFGICKATVVKLVSKYGVHRKRGPRAGASHE